MRFMFGGQANSFNTDLGGLRAPSSSKPLTVSATQLWLAVCTVVQILLANGGLAKHRPLALVRRWLLRNGQFARLAVSSISAFRSPGGSTPIRKATMLAGSSFCTPVKTRWCIVTYRPSICQGQTTLLMGKLFAASLYYKVNPWCIFAIEQSMYATRLKNNQHYLIAGVEGNEWQDHRTEFGPVFTF